VPSVASNPIPRNPTSGQLADLIGKAVRTVNEMKSDGRIPLTADGKIDLAAIVARGLAAHGDDRAGDELDLNAERARLAKEQADAAAMRNAMSRGELLPAGEVRAAMEAAFGACRARLLAIPAKAAPLVVAAGGPAEVRDMLTEVVHEACDELADMRVEAALAEHVGDGAGGDDGDGGVEGPAADDGQRVGRRAPRAVGRGQRRAGQVDDGAG
jgi:hypothetical protein